MESRVLEINVGRCRPNGNQSLINIIRLDVIVINKRLRWLLKIDPKDGLLIIKFFIWLDRHLQIVGRIIARFAMELQVIIFSFPLGVANSRVLINQLSQSLF